MRINVKRCVWIVTMSVAMTLTGGMAAVMAYPSPQEHHDQDYSKNKNYQLGMRDGRDDNAHQRDHFKKRKFKKDEDHKAYEAGYQEGHRDNPSDHR
jgi:hypothetical protein